MSGPLTIISDGAAMIDEIGGDRMRELQRFAELGRLSATLLHEISNPLTAAVLHLEQHHDQSSVNIRHVRRNIQLLQRYVDAARQQVRHESQPTNFYVRPQLSQIRRVLIPLARRRGVRLRFSLDANYRIFGDPVKFQQIISNLVVNAIDSYNGELLSGKDKEVSVTISGRQHWIYIRVADKGAGISAEKLKYLFEPFYSTKGDGLGIGLTVVKQHVEASFHGGISVTSSRHRGTQFTAKLRSTPRYRRRVLTNPSD